MRCIYECKDATVRLHEVGKYFLLKEFMDIEYLKKLKRKENFIILRKEVNKNWVINKIESFIDRYDLKDNYSVKDIQEKIMNDDLFAWQFIKEPGRQNISENVVADFISKLPTVSDFKNLSSSSNLFLYDGEISNTRREGIKSIDFIWETNGRKIYATQKYTNEAGGAQDNQYNDILTFLINTVKNDTNFFIAIVDGNYYTEAKLKELKKFEKENVKVCNSSELNEVLYKIE